MPKSFEDYDNGHNGANCPRCSNEAKAGAVSVRLMKFKNKTANRFENVTSRQIAMCEDCCIEMYEKLVDDLNNEANGGTRPPRSRPLANGNAATDHAPRRRSRRART